MAKLKVIALLLAPLLLLAGCSAFFGYNAFSSLDKPAPPKLSDYTGANGLAKLASDLSSPAVVAALAADPTTTQQVEAWLETTYLSGPLTTPEQQQAAALFGDLNLKTTAGAQLVNNIVAAVLTNPPTGNIASVLQSILPPGCLADQTTFSAMVMGLENANTAYIQLGLSPLSPVPPGLNMGDIAQKAAVSCMMDAVVSAVATNLGVAKNNPAVTTQMYLLATNQPNTISAVTVSDPYTARPAWLVNIFTAAGAMSSYPS
jgi:hypothetical protein